MVNVNELLNSLKPNNPSSVNTILIIIAIIILFSGVIQLRLLLSKKSQDKLNEVELLVDPPIMNTMFDPKSILGDYHILGSYNSCCIGNYVDDSLSLKQLYNIIKTGVRMVDFEIFTIKGETVVASSDNDSDFSRRGSKNTLPIRDCLETVKQALRNAPNKEDPFFIQLRMKTGIKHSYDEVAKQIKTFQHNLLPSLYSSNAKYLPYDIENEFMSRLKNKIIIVVHDYSDILESTYLYEYTNIHVPTLSVKREHDLKHISKQQTTEIKRRNKMSFSTLLPQQLSINNADSSKAIELGFHGILLNFQKQDANFKKTMKMFVLDGNSRSFRKRKESNRNIPVEKTICSDNKPGDNLPTTATINVLGLSQTYSSG